MPAEVRRERRGYEKIECVDIDKRCCFFLTDICICLLILAFLLFQFELPEGVLRGGVIFSYVFSCFLGGMVVSGKQEGKKYLWGLLAGILYYVILVAVSMILNREAFTRIPGVFPALFLCAFGGMLGGMTQAGRK